MTTIAAPDLNAIKSRLGSLSPTAVARLTEHSQAAARILIDCKHLIAYIEELLAERHNGQTSNAPLDGCL